jgi:hypothetical protein
MRGRSRSTSPLNQRRHCPMASGPGPGLSALTGIHRLVDPQAVPRKCGRVETNERQAAVTHAAPLPTAATRSEKLKPDPHHA